MNHCIAPHVTHIDRFSHALCLFKSVLPSLSSSCHLPVTHLPSLPKIFSSRPPNFFFSILLICASAVVLYFYYSCNTVLLLQVISGHNHQYERSYPVYHGSPTQKDYINPKAPVYIVNGAAGNKMFCFTVDGFSFSLI